MSHPMKLPSQGTTLSVSSSSPCTGDALPARTWEDWKAAVLEAAESEESQGGGCSFEACSPSGSDEGLCPPGKYAFIYQAEDSKNRSSRVTTIMRTEHGSRHTLSMNVALACYQGPSQLQLQVNKMGVDVAMPYMMALGTLQRQMVRKVEVLGPIPVKPDVVHPGNNDGMPPLCLATMDIEIQVGCIPGEPGFKAGPSGNETEGQWCPCSIPWSPNRQDQPLELDQGRAYPVVADLFGPLVSMHIKNPPGSNPDGPSPFCAPLTPSSNSSGALLRHNGGQLSIALDLQYWLLDGLDYIRRIRMQTEDLFFAMDNTIEEKWRQLMHQFVEDYYGILKSRLQDVIEASTGPSATGISTSLGLVDINLEQLENEEQMAATSDQGHQNLMPVDSSDISQSAQECVQRQRGGSNTQFTFVLPVERINEHQEDEGLEEQTGSKFVKQAEQKLLVHQSDKSLPDSNADSLEASSLPAEQQHTSGIERVVGMRGQQQVLTGAAILQQRRQIESLMPGGKRHSNLCGGEGLAVRLSAECRGSRFDAILDSYGTGRARASAASKGANGLPAIGVDPTFVDTSRLYDQEVALSPSNWYNTSEAAGQLNQNGIPYGFFPRSLPCFGPVYPVILDINLREASFQHRMRYLKEGGFLDPSATDVVQIKVSSFSADVLLYGYTTIYAAYGDAGFIHAKFEFKSLEYRDYSFEGLKMRGMAQFRLAATAKILTRKRRQRQRLLDFGLRGGKPSSGQQSSALNLFSPESSQGDLCFSTPDASDDGGHNSPTQAMSQRILWKPEVSTILESEALPFTTHPASPSNLVATPCNAIGGSQIEGSALLSATRFRSFSTGTLDGGESAAAASSDNVTEHSMMPQPRTSPFLGEFLGQRSGHTLLPKGVSPCASPAQRPASGPVCEGLGLPAFGMPFHQTGFVSEVGHYNTSPSREDKKSHEQECSRGSLLEADTESSDDGQSKGCDGEKKESCGKGSGEESDSKSADEDMHECVDYYPTQLRPVTIGIADNPIMLQRERILGTNRERNFEGDIYRGKMHLGWIAYEAILCALMVTAAILLYYYALHLQPNKAPTERRAVVYDSVDSKARPFLLRRQFDKTKDSMQSMPGAPGRWTEGTESEEGLQAFGDMLEALQQMADVKTVYSLVQFFTLILLLVRFIYHTSFQPKLSVIAGTLAKFVPDILYYLFMLLAIGTMFTCMLTILFGGGGYSGFSSVSEGLLVVFYAIITGWDASLMSFLHAAADGQNGFSNAATLALAWVVMVIVALFFRFLMALLVAIILRPYARLRKGSMDAPGIHDDLAALFRWLRLTLKECPSGTELERFLSFLQHEKKDGDGLGLAALKPFSPLRRNGPKLLNHPALGNFAKHASMRPLPFKPSNEAKPTLRSTKYGKASSDGQALGLNALKLTAQFTKLSSTDLESPDSTGTYQSGPEQPLQHTSGEKQVLPTPPSPSDSWASRMRKAPQQYFRRSSPVVPVDASSDSPARQNLGQNPRGLNSTNVLDSCASREEWWVHAAAGERHSRMTLEKQGSLHSLQGSHQMARVGVTEGHPSSSVAAGREARKSQIRISLASDNVENELVSRAWGRVQAVVQARWEQEQEQARAAERARLGVLASSLLGPGTTKSLKPSGSKRRSSGTVAAEGARSSRRVTMQEPKELCSISADTATAHEEATTRLTGNAKLAAEQQQQQRQVGEHELRCVAAPAFLPPSYSFRKRRRGQQARERLAHFSSCSAEDEQQCSSEPDSPPIPLSPSPVLTDNYQQGADADPGTSAVTLLHQTSSSSSSSSSSGSSSSMLSTMQGIIVHTEQCIAWVERVQAASQGVRALALCVVGLMRVHAEHKGQSVQQQPLKLPQQCPASLPDSTPSTGDSDPGKAESAELQGMHGAQLSLQLSRLRSVALERLTLSSSGHASLTAAAAGVPELAEANLAELQGMRGEQFSLQVPRLSSVTVERAEAEPKQRGSCPAPSVMGHRAEQRTRLLASGFGTDWGRTSTLAEPSVMGRWAEHRARLLESGFGTDWGRSTAPAETSVMGRWAEQRARLSESGFGSGSERTSPPQASNVMGRWAEQRARLSESGSGTDSERTSAAPVASSGGRWAEQRAQRAGLLESGFSSDSERTSAPPASNVTGPWAEQQARLLKGGFGTDWERSTTPLASSTGGRWAEKRARLLESGFGADSERCSAPPQRSDAGMRKGVCEGLGVEGAGGEGEADGWPRVLLQVSSLPSLPGEVGEEGVAVASVGDGEPHRWTLNPPPLPLQHLSADFPCVPARPHAQHRTFSQGSHPLALSPQEAQGLGSSSTVVWRERAEDVKSTRVQPGMRGKTVWLEEQRAAEAGNSGHFVGPERCSPARDRNLLALEATRPAEEPEALASPMDASSQKTPTKWA
ncbi:hypothetical protein DUNSADRAFT_614 [Dunaliella salina]|uniref:Polycystin cation channel PKD1/PKD2 domain-containing protein n=1 Tax=Dunaliella salina TaxID=3046 RepID=A0ABQ7FYP2_DUNSA|nr:hypothetical protein DUNSADRAFT_614 [Dunaliella salina]|eukprot:KAF5827471.1 hypothetical protein DUNSADRAFT_614 [Dunaliella salina]